MRRSKMSDEQIERVCKMIQYGHTDREIAQAMHSDSSIINHIRHSETYKKVTKNYDLKKNFDLMFW